MALTVHPGCALRAIPPPRREERNVRTAQNTPSETVREVLRCFSKWPMGLHKRVFVPLLAALERSRSPLAHPLNTFQTVSRNCPKRGSSNAPSVDLAGIRRTKWPQKYRFDGPQGYVAGASETFRTVSQGKILGSRVSPGLRSPSARPTAPATRAPRRTPHSSGCRATTSRPLARR
jgi:hypothetical protein